MPTPGVAPYDALLLVSFGGPERPADVLPFLHNVTRGRDVPPERLAEVAEHYDAFGGRSPINDQCRALVAAIRNDLVGAGLDIPVYWGNRNWDPYLRDTLAAMAADGIQRAACFLTSAYASYSGCRQYREDLFDAVVDVPGAPRLDRLRHYFNHPGFVEPFVEATLAALHRLRAEQRSRARLVFATHSIPSAMDEASGRRHAGTGGAAYSGRHHEVAAAVADRVARETGGRRDHDLVYCSRSGPPDVPWLEPDINDHLRELREAGVPAAVVVPIGFVCDHMEVVHDLDTEAARTARELGLGFTRAATPGVHPRFVAMVRDLVLERAAVERGEPDVRRPVAVGAPGWDRCPVGCCANLRDPDRPALCGEDSPAVVGSGR